MLRSTCMLVLGLAAAACALESSYTGPMFNPSEAPHFDYSSLVIPTQTNLPAIQPTAEFSMATTISGIILPTTPLSLSSTLASHASSRSSSQSASSTAASSASRSSSASRTASSTASTSASASASAPAQQSAGAAVANHVGAVGVVVGGLLAGLALV